MGLKKYEMISPQGVTLPVGGKYVENDIRITPKLEPLIVVGSDREQTVQVPEGCVGFSATRVGKIVTEKRQMSGARKFIETPVPTDWMKAQDETTLAFDVDSVFVGYSEDLTLLVRVSQIIITIDRENVLNNITKMDIVCTSYLDYSEVPDVIEEQESIYNIYEGGWSDGLVKSFYLLTPLSEGNLYDFLSLNSNCVDLFDNGEVTIVEERPTIGETGVVYRVIEPTGIVLNGQTLGEISELFRLGESPIFIWLEPLYKLIQESFPFVSTSFSYRKKLPTTNFLPSYVVEEEMRAAFHLYYIKEREDVMIYIQGEEIAEEMGLEEGWQSIGRTFLEGDTYFGHCLRGTTQVVPTLDTTEFLTIQLVLGYSDYQYDGENWSVKKSPRGELIFTNDAIEQKIDGEARAVCTGPKIFLFPQGGLKTDNIPFGSIAYVLGGTI